VFAQRRERHRPADRNPGQTVQPRFDGSRCDRFGCPARLSGFLAAISRRQRWRLFGLVREPQRNRADAIAELAGTTPYGSVH
jgi:hypothetical protein